MVWEYKIGNCRGLTSRTPRNSRFWSLKYFRTSVFSKFNCNRGFVRTNRVTEKSRELNLLCSSLRNKFSFCNISLFFSLFLFRVMEHLTNKRSRLSQHSVAVYYTLEHRSEQKDANQMTQRWGGSFLNWYMYTKKKREKIYRVKYPRIKTVCPTKWKKRKTSRKYSISRR